MFPVNYDGVHSDIGAGNMELEQYQTAPNHMSEMGDEAWLNTGFHEFSVDSELEPPNHEGIADATGNGLYWFWDSIINME